MGFSRSKKFVVFLLSILSIRTLACGDDHWGETGSSGRPGVASSPVPFPKHAFSDERLAMTNEAVLKAPGDKCTHWPPDPPVCFYPLNITGPCDKQKSDSKPPSKQCLCGLGVPPDLSNCACVAPWKRKYQPVVQKLHDALKHNSTLRVAFRNALRELRDLKVVTAQCITTTRRFLSYAEQLLKTPPWQTAKKRNVYNMFATFYLVLDMPSLAVHQSPIEPDATKSVTKQQHLTFLSRWIREYAISWGNFLDTKESARCLDTFKKNKWYCWNDFKIPKHGFKTYNEYFSRHFCNIDEVRPLICPNEKRAVVFPADSTFVYSSSISHTSTINTTHPDETICAKGAIWSIKELLYLSDYREKFADGVFVHAFLSTYNYHRLHAPVGGKILEARVISGQFFLNVSTVKDEKKKVWPYIRDDTGYQFVQQRGKEPPSAAHTILEDCYLGLVVIDTEDKEIGLVAALPIGMAQVSAIKWNIQISDRVEKGAELGTFLFGGSDFVLVFQNKARFRVTAKKNKQSYVRALYGWFGDIPEDEDCAKDTKPPTPATSTFPAT